MTADGWTEVSSRNLLRVRYEPGSRLLRVVFRHAQDLEYTYEDVSEWEYNEIMTAGSVGSRFSELIRSRPDVHPYTSRKIA